MLKRLFDAVVLSCAVVLPLGAEAQVSEKGRAVMDALLISDVVDVLRDEGIAYGRDLEEQMFPNVGGVEWAQAVEAIYAPDRILPAFEEQFVTELERNGADLPAIAAFFSQGAGQKAVSLELSARRALLDDAVEEAARARVEELRADDDPRLEAVNRFIEVGDLIEQNVSGGLNASLAFYRGLEAGGGFETPLPEDEMLSQVWGQEAQVRQDTTDWMTAYLVMAYDPLTDAELEDYIAFSESPAGKKMNAALFVAFDKVFTDVSFRLGKAAATHVAGETL